MPSLFFIFASEVDLRGVEALYDNEWYNLAGGFTAWLVGLLCGLEISAVFI